MQARSGSTGLLVVVCWAPVFLAANEYRAPIDAADQAHLDALDNPPVLQDPPTDAAWAEFIVGFSAILAVPAAGIALLTGLRTARNSGGRTSIRMLGWATFAIGALGSPIALVAAVFGAITCIFDGSVLLASSSPLSYRCPRGRLPRHDFPRVATTP